jgi:hypothetical protein
MKLMKQYNIMDILIFMKYSRTYITLKGCWRYIVDIPYVSIEERRDIDRIKDNF